MANENPSDEILNLNVDELDVDELEQRLELSTATVDDCWGFCYECKELTACTSFDGWCPKLGNCGSYDGCIPET